MSTLSQRSFSGGELAPALYPRVDTVKYSTGARTIRNNMIKKHGGLDSRPGTSFVAEVNNSQFQVRLIPFIFNASQTYVLEFGLTYMRVYKNGVQMTEASAILSGVTNANPGVFTVAAHGLSNGDEVVLSGMQGLTQLNSRNFKVDNVTTNTFTLDEMLTLTPVDTTSLGTYTGGGLVAKVYQIASPYLSTEVGALKFIQSADVITIVHPNYAPYELDRTGDTNWSMTPITFGPKIAAPTGLTGSNGAGSSLSWVVTAVDIETGDESLPSGSFDGPNTIPTTLSWTAVTGAGSYNVYRFDGGVYGFIGSAGDGLTSFVDNGVTPSIDDSPPQTRALFNSTDDYPSTVTYFQQRLMFGNSNNNPETTWASRSGRFKNFTISYPSQADDAITFALVGKQVNSVQHLVDIGKLVMLTSGGELAALGDANGVLSPSAINTRQYSYHGSTGLSPVIIGSNLLYNQARGSIVRSLAYSFQIDGYTGTDLTLFSSHLFDGFSLVDWTYAQIPNSILWAARSDGLLLGLTYIEEQQIWGWHRHDFDGSVENVCAVPEGTEDVLYLVVRRQVNGQIRRYIERMSTRFISNIVDYNACDASLKYDGRNLSATTMTLTGGSGVWDYTQTLTLTASNVLGGFIFHSTDIGNQIFLDNYDVNGNFIDRIRFTITGYTSAFIVTGTANRDVDVALQGVSITTWSKAVSQVTGLWHIEGKSVSVLGDGFVVASPNNDEYDILTVTNGSITLDKPYGVITVGLPVTCDIETLDVDTANGESIIDKKKNVGKVVAWVQSSRGLWVGGKPPDDDDVDPLQDLHELQVRDEEDYDLPVSLVTKAVDIIIKPEWNSNGRVFIRQVDPLPLSVLSISPIGMFPVRGA